MSPICRIQSTHLDHTKKSIVHSQTLRLSRLCSLKKILKVQKATWDHGFLKEDTQIKSFDKEMSKAKFNFSRKVKPKGKKEKGIILLVT